MRMHIRAAALLMAALTGSTASATTFIDDNFSTFNPGDLVGQNGWNQVGAPTTNPLQVSGGQVVSPAPQGDNQDAVKNFYEDGTTLFNAPGDLYYGLHLTLQSAPVLGTGSSATYTSPSYFIALSEGTYGSSFPDFRLMAVDNSANVPNTYLLETRITGQAGTQFAAGTVPLNYGQQYNVIVEAHMTTNTNDPTLRLNETSTIYINPVDDTLPETPYVIAHHQDVNSSGSPSPATAPAGLGSIVISQFENHVTGKTGESAYSIATLRVADTFSEASHAVPGDVNFDGIVNGLDIAAMASHWVQSAPYVTGDANGDFVVNGLDIAQVASHWLQSWSPPAGAASAVPEPSTLALAGFGLVAAAIGLRRRRAVVAG